MATYLDYARRDGERPERWPNLREAASKAWMGQTAVIGRRPWLVVGYDGKMWELENEFSERMRVNQFEVLDYQSDNNRIIAASRMEGSPLSAGVTLAACGCDVGNLDFDQETYEWSVLTEEGSPVNVEARIAELEEADWRVDQTVSTVMKEADYDPISVGSPSEHYSCPECGSNSVQLHPDSYDGLVCTECGFAGFEGEFVAEPPDDDRPGSGTIDDYNDWQYASVIKEAPGKDHLPAATPKRNRQYEHVLESCKKEHPDYSEDRCKELAARTVNKERRKKHELKDSKLGRTAKIERRGEQYCVVSEDGKKNLGCEDSMEAAKKRLKEVEYFKHQGAMALIDIYAGEGISDRADNVDPLVCPSCGSHTVEMMNSENSQFHCLACGNSFKHEVIKNPSAPKEKKGSTFQLVDSDGKPVASGHYYNLHGDKYKIPDVIKILDIGDDHVVATVDSNPTPLKLTVDDIQKEGYSFEALPITSHIEKHDLREAVSWTDPAPAAPTYENIQRGYPDIAPAGDRSFMRESEFTLPTPSGGTLWVRADNQGSVTGWSVPSFDGGPGSWSSRDLEKVQAMVDAATAEGARSEAKTARRNFSPAEQKKLIEEKGSARNKDKLRLDDSHYVESGVEDDPDFLF